MTLLGRLKRWELVTTAVAGGLLLFTSTTAYRTVIPADDIPSTWDLMYFIEAMDQDGNGRIHPDLNKDTPYVVVKLQR